MSFVLFSDRYKGFACKFVSQMVYRVRICVVLEIVFYVYLFWFVMFLLRDESVHLYDVEYKGYVVVASHVLLSDRKQTPAITT